MGVALLDGSSLLSVALGGSSSIEMCRHARCRSCGDDRSQQRLSVVPGGLSLHREVSPYMVGYPCRCQKSTAAVLHWWVSPFSMDHPCCLLRSVGHPPSVGVAVLDGSSLLPVALGGSSLHRWVSPCSMGHPCRSQQRLSSIVGCRRSGGHSPSRCVAMLYGLSLQKSTAAVLH